MLTYSTENWIWSIWQKHPCKNMSFEEVKRFELEGQYSFRHFFPSANIILWCREPCSVCPISVMARAGETKACRDWACLQLLQEDGISMDATCRESQEYCRPVSDTSRESEGCRRSHICSLHNSWGLGWPCSVYGSAIMGFGYLGVACPPYW
jgi:hypothetical protein